jgi:hypothetical protein
VSAELVIATPLLLAILMLVIQTALWAHAAHVAHAAAGAGAETARAYGSTASAGRAQAAYVLARTGPSILTGVRIDAQRGPDTTRVRVHGRAINLIPGLALPVDEVVTAVTETFRSDLG